MIRQILAFIVKVLPALERHLGTHARSSFAAFVLQEHENRPDLWVGRLHYSLRPTPSAHFRWWLQRVRAFTVLTST
jgi:hypothetical protein